MKCSKLFLLLLVIKTASQSSAENYDYMYDSVTDHNDEEAKDSCDSGYVWNEELKECEDEDECKTGNFYCFGGEVCENTDGSYLCQQVDCEDDERLVNSTCVPKDQCENGYRFNPTRDECENIDECLEAGNGQSPCDEDMICEDTPGSYNCIKSTCKPGYVEGKLWFGKASCLDIDECSIGTHNCTENEICVNFDGSFDCDCNLGFEKNSNGICEDIDECTKYGIDGVNPCNSMMSICINTPGSFNCSCRDGFQLLSRNTCENINECELDPNPCIETQVCFDKFGSFECRCRPGWTPTDDGSCLPPPVSDCHEDVALLMDCESRGDGEVCAVQNGQINCVCRSGFTRSADGFCKPIVTTPPPPSDSNSKLCHGITTEGDDCTCPDGFKLNNSGDDAICMDINECLTNPCFEDEKCVNTIGSFQCVIISCPSPYRLVANDTCEDRRIINCSNDRKSCLKPFRKPIRIRHSLIAVENNVSMAKLLELNRLEKPGFFYTARIKRVIYKSQWYEDISLEDQLSLGNDLIQNFRIISRGSRLVLFLVKPIVGPRELIVEIDVVDKARQWLGVAERYSVHVFVSKYDGINFN